MATLMDTVQEHMVTRGERMTAQRRLILQTLEALHDHPTAEQIFQQAAQKDASLHLSTVYRTLRWLQSLGMVDPRWFDDGRRQERFDPVHTGEHHHFRCRCCDHIIEFSSPLFASLAADFVRQHGGQIDSSSLVLYGVCQQCLSKAD